MNVPACAAGGAAALRHEKRTKSSID